MTLTLSEIIASLLSEFQSANVTAEINREHWREIYMNSPLLSEFSPSRIRISTAKILMPLAIENIDEAKTYDLGITPRQIALSLPERLGEKRMELGHLIFGKLARKGKQYFLNTQLVSDVLEKLTKNYSENLSEVELNDVSSKLKNIQQEFVSKPNVAREANFIFRTTDLEKIDKNRLFQFEIQVIVD